MRVAAEIGTEIDAAELHFRKVMATPTRTAVALANNGYDLGKLELREYEMIADVAEKAKDWRTRQAVIPLIIAHLKLEQHLWGISLKYEPKG